MAGSGPGEGKRRPQTESVGRGRTDGRCEAAGLAVGGGLQGTPTGSTRRTTGAVGPERAELAFRRSERRLPGAMRVTLLARRLPRVGLSGRPSGRAYRAPALAPCLERIRMAAAGRAPLHYVIRHSYLGRAGWAG